MTATASTPAVAAGAALPSATAGASGEQPQVLSRIRAIAEARPFLADAALAVVLDVLTAIPLIGLEDRWWVWLLDQALVLPLAFRRRWPTAVFAAISTAALLQWLLNVPLAADASLLAGLYTLAVHRSRRQATLAAAALEVGVVLASYRFAPADEGQLYSLIFLTGMVLAALFGGAAIRTRRDYLEALVERARRAENDRRQEALLAATRERTRVAREMHDIVAHSLSVMIALADGAGRTEDPAEVGTALATVSRTGREALTEMRRVLGVLRDDGQPIGRSPQPSLQQLPELADRLRSLGHQVELVVAGRPRTLPATEDATAYRIVQEGLTNVVKHARAATRIAVTVDWETEALRLIVSDNGRPVVGTTLAGHGLIGMAERVAVFNGTVSAGPLPSGGWAVEALLPIG